MISMFNLGDIVVTKIMQGEVYKNLDTNKNVLYFEALIKENTSENMQKRALCRVPDFVTDLHSDSDMDGDYCVPYKHDFSLPIKEEYENSVGIKHNEKILYTLSQLDNATVFIDCQDHIEEPVIQQSEEIFPAIYVIDIDDNSLQYKTKHRVEGGLRILKLDGKAASIEYDEAPEEIQDDDGYVTINFPKSWAGYKALIKYERTVKCNKMVFNPDAEIKMEYSPDQVVKYVCYPGLKISLDDKE